MFTAITPVRADHASSPAPEALHDFTTEASTQETDPIELTNLTPASSELGTPSTGTFDEKTTRPSQTPSHEDHSSAALVSLQIAKHGTSSTENVHGTTQHSVRNASSGTQNTSYINQTALTHTKPSVSVDGNIPSATLSTSENVQYPTTTDDKSMKNMTQELMVTKTDLPNTRSTAATTVQHISSKGGSTSNANGYSLFSNTHQPSTDAGERADTVHTTQNMSIEITTAHVDKYAYGKDTTSSSANSKTSTESQGLHRSLQLHCTCSRRRNLTRVTSSSSDDIKEELSVDVSTLSATRRRKESAKDTRPSTAQIGFVCAVVVSVLFGGIILCDLPYICT